MKNEFFHRFLGQPRFKRSSLEAVSRPSWRTLILIFTFSCSSHIVVGHFTVTQFVLVFLTLCFDMFLATDIIILVSEFFEGVVNGQRSTCNWQRRLKRLSAPHDTRLWSTGYSPRSHCGSKKLKSARNRFTSEFSLLKM